MSFIILNVATLAATRAPTYSLRVGIPKTRWFTNRGGTKKRASGVQRVILNQ